MPEIKYRYDSQNNVTGILTVICVYTVIGMIIILKRVRLESLGALGPRLAVALIAIFYGLFLGYIVADLISCLLETKIKVTES